MNDEIRWDLDEAPYASYFDEPLTKRQAMIDLFSDLTEARGTDDDHFYGAYARGGGGGGGGRGLPTSRAAMQGLGKKSATGAAGTQTSKLSPKELQSMQYADLAKLSLDRQTRLAWAQQNRKNIGAYAPGAQKKADEHIGQLQADVDALGNEFGRRGMRAPAPSQGVVNQAMAPAAELRRQRRAEARMQRPADAQARLDSVKDKRAQVLDPDKAKSTAKTELAKGDGPLLTAPENTNPVIKTGPLTHAKRRAGDAPVEREPGTGFRVNSGHKDLLSGEITGLQARGKDSSNVLQIGELNGQKVMVKPAANLTNKMWRPYSQPTRMDLENEMAAQAVNNRLGMVDMPKVAIRDVKGNGPSLVQTMRDGVSGAERPMAELPPDQVRKMAVFDVVTGNTDRKVQNYMVSPEGNLVAIDHGLAMPVARVRQNGNHEALRTTAETGSRVLDPVEVEALESFRAQKVLVNGELQELVGQSAIELMWERVDRLINDGELPDVRTWETDQWP